MGDVKLGVWSPRTVMRTVEVTGGEAFVTGRTGHRADSRATPCRSCETTYVRPSVTRLEEITYDAGRAALADQEALVSGIRQRAGTLLAAHALVASFFGGPAIERDGFDLFTWTAVGALVAGLILAAGILAPWQLQFAVDARNIYWGLGVQAKEEALEGTLGWLAAVGFSYEDLRRQNRQKVLLISRMSAALGIVMVLQTLLWILVLGLD
jgi:hypothetical protein